MIENFDLKMHKSKTMMLQIWMIETEKEINEEGYGELERTIERWKRKRWMNNEGRYRAIVHWYIHYKQKEIER